MSLIFLITTDHDQILQYFSLSVGLSWKVSTWEGREGAVRQHAHVSHLPRCLSEYSYVCDIIQETSVASRDSCSPSRRGRRAAHFTEERKIRQKKLSLICIIVFYDVAGVRTEERGGVRRQLFSFPFDLVGMSMNTTSLMNLQIQIQN